MNFVGLRYLLHIHSLDTIRQYYRLLACISRIWRMVTSGILAMQFMMIWKDAVSLIDNFIRL